ncbi:MAG: hypothetical protein AAFV33_05205 [Chloroflexota bacterium]
MSPFHLPQPRKVSFQFSALLFLSLPRGLLGLLHVVAQAHAQLFTRHRCEDHHRQ